MNAAQHGFPAAKTPVRIRSAHGWIWDDVDHAMSACLANRFRETIATHHLRTTTATPTDTNTLGHYARGRAIGDVL